ncbi:MFS transporter [Pseudoalteromonas sp. MMG022]|uniref:MFS transporter n=1 Tax=Pseudoalteromonas sp. MMG022 TaxID=2909978 RepID=UPI001F02B9E2|nr:MFS transporter [Pseudoalteromonas sp. MMG022]MCF6437395.1 MFS transporter [Pseudoalteromonas sp. MMG022]
MLIIAMLLLSSSQLASQIFFPVLPQIAADLQMSQGLSQMMITGYFICLGLSQLVVGPLRDKYGDRQVFLAGQLVFVVGSICCALATNTECFALGRLLQGLGAAAPLLISRTILGAVYRGSQLREALGYLAMVASCVAILAPWFGGVLASWADWQFVAWALSAYLMIVALIGYWLLPTELSSNVAVSLYPHHIFKQYLALLSAPKFVAIALFKWTPTFIYMTTQLYFPFVLQQQFALSEAQFGSVMMLPMAGLLVGSLLSRKLQRHLNMAWVTGMFWPLLVLSGVCYMFMSFTLLNALFAYGLVMVMFGGYFAIYIQMLSEHFCEHAGSANALIGACELLLFTVLAVACNSYFIDVPSDMAWITWFMAVLLGWAWLTLFLSKWSWHRFLLDKRARSM